jgi:hypothetical protein
MSKNDNIPPLCKCLCGQPVGRCKRTGRWNTYLHGHSSKNNASNSGKFKPGNKFSKGRPAGSRNKVSINAMKLLKDEEKALSRKAIESAMNGNTQMLQFCLSRLLPPPPKDTPVRLSGMPVCNDVKSSVALSSFILKQLSEGNLTPTQAHLISGIVEKHLRCLQLTDVEQRLEDIEARLEKVG